MTHEEYIKNLEELKRKAERAIIDKAPGIEKEVLQILSDYMDEKFDTKDGNFVANDNAKKALNGFTDTLIEAMTELKDYKGAVSSYLKNFKDVSTLMEEYQSSNGVNVKQARLGAAQELVTAEIINQYSENGLNPGFVQPLRELLFDNITGGLNKKQAMAQLREFIAGGKDTTGKLHRYLEQTAQQGVDSYTGATNVRIMQTFKINTFIVSGSLIKTSSPQCRHVINKLDGILDRKDWPAVEDIAEDNGLIEGTTFDNLPINKLHWGCRHEFTPVSMTEEQRKRITATPTNPAGEGPKPKKFDATKTPIAPRSAPKTPQTKKTTTVNLSALLNDREFADYYKKFEKKFEEKKSEFPKLEYPEYLTMEMYSGSSYHELNGYLAGRREVTDTRKEYLNNFETVLNKGLSKLSDFTGTAYRGLNLTKEQIDNYKKAFQEGRPVIENQFTSTSKDPKKFFRAKNTHWIIESKTGKSIVKIVDIESEDEILYRSKTKFQIESIETKEVDGRDVTVMRLKEI